MHRLQSSRNEHRDTVENGRLHNFALEEEKLIHVVSSETGYLDFETPQYLKAEQKRLFSMVTSPLKSRYIERYGAAICELWKLIYQCHEVLLQSLSDMASESVDLIIAYTYSINLCDPVSYEMHHSEDQPRCQLQKPCYDTHILLISGFNRVSYEAYRRNYPNKEVVMTCKYFPMETFQIPRVEADEWDKIRFSPSPSRLELPECCLRSVPMTSILNSGPQWLRGINLSNNHISVLPSSLCDIQLLRSLALHGNDLTDASFPDNFSQLVNLTDLNLGENKLTQLPDGICGFQRLRTLKIFGNKLTSLPEKIGELEKLEYLDVSGNELSSIPESVFDLINLEHLSLFDNKITYLSSRIGELAILKLLNVSENLLTHLPYQLLDCGRLREMYIGQNRYNSNHIFSPKRWWQRSLNPRYPEYIGEMKHRAVGIYAMESASRLTWEREL